MADFDKLEQEAQQAAESHSGDVDKAISEGEHQVDDRVGQDGSSQVQDAGNDVEKELGTEQASPPPGQQ
jgi:hypothetical protein